MGKLASVTALIAFACALGAAALAGCSVIAGVDFGDAHESLSEGGAGPGDDEGEVALLPDGSTAGCRPDQVICNGACVAKADPAYGCGAADCIPCSVPFGKASTCKNGVCAPEGCSTGRGDCDGDPKNGCEADLTAPATCGACNTQCPVASPLCAATGCVSTCPGGTMMCGQSCIDTKTSIENCGGCGTKCNAPANGDPACLNGTCGFSCRTGFGDCANNPAKDCNALPKWYQDGDGDGVGSAVSVQACAAPAGHVAMSGDCLDSNPDVKPGQAMFFGTSFMNAAGVESYDYDCNGVEVEQFPEHWPGSCVGGCFQTGYTPKSPARAGGGVDAYCGSTTYRECVDNNLNLASLHPAAAPGCIATSYQNAAVACH